MSRFRHLMLFATSIVVGVASVAIAAETSKVTVTNRSDWRIDQFFMSPSASDDWGNDLLGEKVLDKGSTLTLSEIPCNLWDIRVVDVDGDECILKGINLCSADATWDITSQGLLECEAESEESEE